MKNLSCQIVNLTQHPASPDQILKGVADLSGFALAELKSLLTFDALPKRGEAVDRAARIAALAAASGANSAMIGGALWLMAPLEKELLKVGLKPVYAFSRRESIEDPATGVKRSIFKHIGFVEVS